MLGAGKNKNYAMIFGFTLFSSFIYCIFFLANLNINIYLFLLCRSSCSEYKK